MGSQTWTSTSFGGRTNGEAPEGSTSLSRLLRLLWSRGELSRAELSQRSGLARSTVSSLVGQLLELGLVEETRRAPSNGGRRAVLLRFVAGRGSALGVELGASHLTVVVTDLLGRVLARVDRACPAQDQPRQALAVLGELVDEALAESRVGRGTLAGLGIAVPCPVDPKLPNALSRRILPAWSDVRLHEWLAERYCLPIAMDNDANVGAVAEHLWGAGRGVEHLVYVKLGTGIGAGILVRGQAYRGASGIAGELGHTSVREQGPMCRCGLPGCLEAVAGAAAMRRTVTELSGVDASHRRLRDIATAAATGAAAESAAVAQAGADIGIALASVVNLINPGRIVLGGSLVLAGDVLLGPLRQALDERALATAVARTEVVPGSLGPNAVALGAAGLVVESVLADPTLLSPSPAPAQVGPERRIHA